MRNFERPGRSAALERFVDYFSDNTSDSISTWVDEPLGPRGLTLSAGAPS